MLLKSFFAILFLLVTNNNLLAENIDYSVWLYEFKIKAPVTAKSGKKSYEISGSILSREKTYKFFR